MLMYGFQKHLNSEFPSQIIVDSTQFCNLACIHCPHPNFIKTDAYSGSHLNVELHKKLIDEVATDGLGICQYIRYTANGETLIHPKFDEMIEYAGKYSKTRINVTTNGVLLTEKKAKTLLDAGVNVFDISIDAFSDETYSKIRVKGDLNKVRPNVLNLIKLIKEGNYDTKLVISFVEQPLNIHETKQFENFWNDSGADFVIIRRLHSAGGAKNGIKSKMEEDFKYIKRKPCLYPWERLTITPEGDLSYCPTDWMNKSHFVHFSKTTIKEAWQSQFMYNLRQAHLSNNYKGFDFCKQCPDWIHTRWPEEGRGYSDMMQELIPSDLL
ncbi:radical SAM superfamily enzyme, MoaA/NifB/PqqE/SkfB family [Arcobacter venerupis]|uniref:Radical SAM superfamily enzyme, MoaA/NifB/PqqE/SkfB family n=1 Tax=Arcobacter venerupis TaxID=1054033 RepID=A0AAE7BDN7_9BACT|nr:radical SAM protein [Arcobacter venerupis]QKF68397.1 radical SAM superfamily enzyme, MoaA/NifB/PqqE/SkfB family [Arcobacter venerupis]RWS49016.1 radical SAM protein [Arcobacter venerupis]